ncbi:16S rRNA (cytosine(1402)-N(4))-methyltransferase RsmH [Candidatus Gracilibacteria bacterium]|nr:16S rRNA (cytosine(1402)-N(4))-methyltransferase RsmH [Candidatus Gracilibacteria bacterium]
MHHDPVLISEIETIFLARSLHHVVVDATLGLGGHASMFASHMSPGDMLIGIDRDSDNLAIARSKIPYSSCDLHLVHSSFSDIDTILDEKGIETIDFILYDLGVSSAHYDDGERGFSIRYDAPLDMRFDRTSGRTARDLVMTASEYDLRDLMFRFADEKKSVHIARAIVEARKTKSINTTFELLEIIRGSSYDKDSPKRVFQALRIAINSEFEHIEISIAKAIAKLAIGGQIAIISFHSIEDRIVKNLVMPYLTGTIDEYTGQTIVPARLTKYNKKLILPTELEIDHNPRSRSAKLRVLTRIN